MLKFFYLGGNRLQCGIKFLIVSGSFFQDIYFDTHVQKKRERVVEIWFLIRGTTKKIMPYTVKVFRRFLLTFS